jgi:hypothetical protein
MFMRGFARLGVVCTILYWCGVMCWIFQPWGPWVIPGSGAAAAASAIAYRPGPVYGPDSFNAYDPYGPTVSVTPVAAVGPGPVAGPVPGPFGAPPPGWVFSGDAWNILGFATGCYIVIFGFFWAIAGFFRPWYVPVYRKDCD